MNENAALGDAVVCLRCSECETTVGVVTDEGTEYAACHCTLEMGESGRLPLDMLAMFFPPQWEYVAKRADLSGDDR